MSPTNDDDRTEGAAPPVRRRTIRRDPRSSQLLERGEGPGPEEDPDPDVASPSEATLAGGPGTDAAYREGGPESDEEQGPPNDRAGGTGGEGGYSTLNGGVYQDEGDPEDVSHGGG